MGKPTVLLQLDTDERCSVFDAVVAVDAGADRLLHQAGVTPENVRPLVHGAIFTRGGADLNRTAIFVGGSDVAAGENVLQAVVDSFFGPMRVSVMLDSAGANTTAAAAVLCARRHVSLAGEKFLVLASTGPVGRRIVQMLALAGAEVVAASRRLDRAEAVCEFVAARVPEARVSPLAVDSAAVPSSALNNVTGVFAAGAAGVELLSLDAWSTAERLKVAVDVNAVPPAGINGIEVTDKATDRHGVICYGAIGAGGLKMKIHKAALARLFESNDAVLDAKEIYELGVAIDS